MANYGFNNLVVQVDNSAGSLVDISQYVTEISDFEVKAIIEESQTAGDAAVERLFTNIVDHSPVTLKGFYDDSASGGPDALFGNNQRGNTRTLKVTWGSTKTSSIEALIESYKRRALQKQLHKYEVVLNPSGALTEA